MSLVVLIPVAIALLLLLAIRIEASKIKERETIKASSIGTVLLLLFFAASLFFGI